MAMSELTSDAKRGGARVFGIIFQFLAVAALVGTLAAMAYVAHLGTDIGIDGTKDPLTWIVLASGLFVTCVLAGLGYILGILCAIYDRQEPAERVLDVVPRTMPRTQPSKPPPYRPSPITLIEDEIVAPTPPVQRPVSPPPLREPKAPTSREDEKSVLWECLTRERHIGQTEPD